MSYKIVVARYNENIEWLKPDMNNVIIYNKGQKLNMENEILLKNVGRESETYLNYIISNYNNLPDVTVFTQGRIDDHKHAWNDFYPEKESGPLAYLMAIKNWTFENGKSLPQPPLYESVNFKKKHVWGKEWNKNYNNSGHWYLENAYLNNKPITFEEWFTKNINETYPNPMYAYWAGIFAINKEIILRKPVEYYKKLITQVVHHSNPAEGHFFERSWYYIFN